MRYAIVTTEHPDPKTLDPKDQSGFERFYQSNRGAGGQVGENPG